MDRQKLDCGDSKATQMVDEDRITEGRERPALVGSQVVAQHAEATNMRLVDYRFRPRYCRRAIIAPSEALIGDDSLHDTWRTVAPVEGKIRARRIDAVAVKRIGVAPFAMQTSGIRIEQELVRIEAMTGLRFVGAMGTEAIDQPGPGIGKVTVPDLVGAFRQVVAHDLAPPGRIEQAELQARGMSGEHRKIDTQTIPRRPQGPGCAGEQSIGPGRRQRHLHTSGRSITVDSGGRVSSRE